jgi:alpha-N-arabinofuranosidase
MDEMVQQHSEIMDRSDPNKRLGLIVDEWGTWYNVEPGTNPGFLYQQSTLRDALVAGINLNIFNRHCERVTMANIAQTINVLQAMILTDKERMIKTPTFHVFEMYTVHHDATLLPADVETPDYEIEGEKVPSLHVSASRDASGAVHVSLCNLDPNRPAAVQCELRGVKPSKVSGRVLTAPEVNSHNTFEQPDLVKTSAFNDAKLTENGLTTTLPPKCVVVLKLE